MMLLTLAMHRRVEVRCISFVVGDDSCSDGACVVVVCKLKDEGFFVKMCDEDKVEESLCMVDGQNKVSSKV